jgi:hypothetical protein
VKRRGTSVLLLPLLAAMALFYPAATRRGSFGSAQTLGSQAKENARNKTEGVTEEWHGGRAAVQRFFGLPDDKHGRSAWQNDPRKNATLNFLIVTVPDPVDSGLPHVYDRYMAAVQAAVQTQSYFLYKFDLPWEDCHLRGKDKDSKENKDSENHANNAPLDDSEQPEKPCKERRFAKEPGFLLLSNPTKKNQIDLLLIYLVGETPTSGIHKRVLSVALNEIGRYCGWRKDGRDPVPAAEWPHSPTCEGKGEVRILGPSFSGSAQSLDLALSGWLDSIRRVNPTPPVRLVSGSATAIQNDELQESDFYNTRTRLGSQFSFQSMENPDIVSEPRFWDYLKAAQPCGSLVKVAILSESGTVYGQEQNKKPKMMSEEGNQSNFKSSDPGNQRPDARERCKVEIEKTTIPFPLHISQLRAVSEKLRQLQQEATPQPQISNKALPLAESLEDAGSRRDIQTFSPANAVTAEQVIANLLSTISRERYQYVGFTATDTRDIMFLAQEVREHSPATVLFTFGPDLLFLHPEINQTLRGMLIVTSYPLSNSNQLWSVPTHPETRLQFPDDSTEGVYNATLALLGDDKDMAEFSPPFIDMHNVSEAVGPPVWITVVGRDRLWPVTAYDVTSVPDVKKYTYRLSCERAGAIDKKYLWSGLYSEATLIFVTVFAVHCIVFSLPLLKRYQRTDSPRVVRMTRKSKEPATGWLGTWFDKVFGAAVFERHRRAGELCLLAGCGSLGTFLVVLITALFIPAGTMRRLGAWGGLSWAPIAAIATCCAAAILLVFGSVALLIAILRPAGDRGRLTATAWGPIAAGSSAAVGLALLLSWTWISPLWGGDYLAALFTSMRSLDLLSGVSALTPLFLISIAGFVWAVGSFQRIRQLDVLDGNAESSAFGRLDLGEIHHPPDQPSNYLTCPSLRLPASILVLSFAVIAGAYLGLHLVRSLEYGFFYGLLVVSFFFVSLALWHGVLRFCWVWEQTHNLLKHFSLTPLRVACKRFRDCYPALPKIDLASPTAGLAHLECSVEQARILWVWANRLVKAGKVQSKVVGGTALPMANRNAALERLGAYEVERLVQEASDYLILARKADSDKRWREVMSCQYASREALSNVAAEVADVLQNSWAEMREASNETTESSTATPEKVVRLAEEFLAGRLAHFLACVFPYLQNLIFTSVAGLLLLLFAVGSYPFQPHNLLLLFNWVIILSVVGIALWDFAQMDRDPMLSYLNGTKPGHINWDGEFIFRVFTYGIIPILALLGAQFPQSVGQILSHLTPGEGMHP